ncbi:DUF5518 domain-containing protein [Saliphagus sp. LR7]|uniref:DUF5518 domain-containing protein n=1 Tax=Saliphagus sp. LR7 TaxID=2282654 RepID=UPI000DF8062D|nr:DUF5518 domain-containing protein [Saliphagus sp. LR7]
MGTIVNAVVGAVAAVVLAFLPFSTVLGGAVSGFLEGEDGRAGTLVGALAGLITLLPFAGLGLLGLAVLSAWLGVLGVPAGGIAAMIVVVGLVTAAAVVYTVGFSAAGGYLGAVLAREFPEHRASARDTLGMGRDRPTDRERYTSLDEEPHAGAGRDDADLDPIDRALEDDRERTGSSSTGDGTDPDRFDR